MEKRYDLVVVGAGSAGLSAATMAVRLGARVALVERERVGGDCTWTGCVPSKALLHAAKVAHQMRHAADYGLPSQDPEVDLGAVMGQVRAAVERVYAHETPEALAGYGVDVVQGTARFVNAHALETGGSVLVGKRLVICTGAEPTVPPIPGLERAPYLTYKDVYGLRELPARLVVVGGGSVGVEMSQAFARLGSRVTLFGRSKRLLSKADPEASAALEGALARDGVTVHTGAEVERVERGRGNAWRASGGGREAEGDALLVATGRQPQVQGLGLEQVGVRVGEHGIEVGEDLRTSCGHIYAAGDVTGSFQYTHYAGWQGYIAARNALLPGAKDGARDTVPWSLFTDPEVAQVGLSEEEARERGERVVVHRRAAEHIDRAQTLGDTSGFVKLLARPDGTLLGATIVAPAASEVGNELAVAVQRGLKLGDLAGCIHIYPTYGLSVQQMGGEAAAARLLRGWRGRALRAVVRWLP
jgi:pyruvate/2-oxoglutarate dehydrogenase complex dihydrolipoamide dehydrogenase (E3) component